MAELKDRHGKTVAVLSPKDAPYTISQTVVKTYGAFERTYVLNYSYLKENGQKTEKISGILLNTVMSK